MNDAAWAHGALRLESAGSAHFRPSLIDERAPVPAITAQTVPGRTEHGVAPFLVLKNIAVKQLAIAGCPILDVLCQGWDSTVLSVLGFFFCSLMSTFERGFER